MQISNDSFFLNYLANSQRQLDTLSLRLSTGKRINSAADDPSGLAIATRLQSRVNNYDIANQNIDRATSLLSTIDTTIGSAEDIVTQMQNIATQAQDGTLSSSDRTDLQNQYNNLKSSYDNLISKSSYNGVNYLNNTNTVKINTGDSSMNITGSDLTSGGAGGVNLESVDLTTQAGADAAVAQLKTSQDALITVRSSYGADTNVLNSIHDMNANLSVNYADAQSKIMDADMAKTMSDFTKEQIMQQSNLQVLSLRNQLNSSILNLFK